MFAPAVLKWAREAAELDLSEAARRAGISIETLQSWEDGTAKPTFQQGEEFSKRLHVPLTYFFRDEPPPKGIELPEGYLRLPQGYLRLPQGSRAHAKPTLEFQAAMWDAEYKQDWLQDFRQAFLAQTLLPGCIGQVLEVLDARSGALEQAGNSPQQCAELLTGLIDDLWDIGFMVFRNDVVKHDTTRRLDPAEFQGFAMYDAYAPVIFINGNDSVDGQLVTVLNGLAYLFRQVEHAGAEPAAELQVAVAEERPAYGGEAVLNAVERVRAAAERAPREEVPADGKAFFPRPLGRSAEKRARFRAEGVREFWHDVPYKAGGIGFLEALTYAAVSSITLYHEAGRVSGLGWAAIDNLEEMLELGPGILPASLR